MRDGVLTRETSASGCLRGAPGFGLAPRGEQRCPCSLQGGRRVRLRPRLGVNLRRRRRGGAPAPSCPSRCRRAKQVERASARRPCPRTRVGDQAVGSTCSRIAWVAEVGERRSLQVERPGEGSLGDGRRPGAVRAVVFDETASGPIRATRGDGDGAAMPHPPRAQEGVRGRVASPSCGRKHRRREVRRGGAIDRGSTRTARIHRRERTEPRLRTRLREGPPFGGTRAGRGDGRSWSLAVKRSSTTVGSSGTRLGRSPRIMPADGSGPG